MPTIGRKTLKSLRARTERIDRIFQYIGYTLLLAYFLFTIAAWLSYQTALRITTVSVVGARAVDGDRILAIAHDALSKKFLQKIDRNNIFLYPKRYILNEIRREDERVRSVDAVVSGRKLLTISVLEYVPAILACPDMATSSTSTASCYLGDDRGYLFAQAPEYSGYLFPVYITHHSSSTPQTEDVIGTFVLPPNEFTALGRFLFILQKDGLIVHKVEYKGAGDYEITTEKTWSILWSSTKDPEESANNLRLALRSFDEDHTDMGTIATIDLRFGNKIFYK